MSIFKNYMKHVKEIDDDKLLKIMIMTDIKDAKGNRK